MIVASGFGQRDAQAVQGVDLQFDGVDEIDGFVRRRSAPPSWLNGEQVFEDTHHDLTVVLRR